MTDQSPEQTPPELLPDNQTQFIGEESIWESASLPTSPKIEGEPVPPPAGPLARYRLPLMIGGGLFTLLLVMIVVVASMRPRTTVPKAQVEPTPSPTAMVQPDTEYTRRLNQLKAELDTADPTKNTLPFPQVNLRLRLEDEQR
jgi:hypothetical protein